MCDALKPEKQQARVLTVAEVEFLESCLTNEKMSLTDRVACGVMLFCLYSRSRWSDVKRIYGFVQDVKESEGKISGYLECRTRSHKTSRLVAKSGLAMPLVAPVWGVGNLPWGLIFIKLCQSSNRPVESLSNEPMLNAPTPDGSWSGRSVTTTEAGKWLRKILAGMKGDAIFTTIHALKATPLSWCAKWPTYVHCLVITQQAKRLLSVTGETTLQSPSVTSISFYNRLELEPFHQTPPDLE